MHIFPLECSSPGVFHAWLRKDASLSRLSRFVEQCKGMHDGNNHAHSKSSESHRTRSELCAQQIERESQNRQNRRRTMLVDDATRSHGLDGSTPKLPLGSDRVWGWRKTPSKIGYVSGGNLAPQMRGCESPHAGADSIARESERDRCASEASIAGESPRCRSRSLDRRSESPHAGADSIARESERARCAGRSLDRWPRVDERSRSSSGAKSAPRPDIYVGEANFRLRPTGCM